jgi:FKBP-type peptidyl-prolyl cis-trans isomerase SlyD
MVSIPADHDHEHDHEHERAPRQFGAPQKISAGKYVTINYTLRTNGQIRHIRSSVWGDEPLMYQQGEGRLLPALERALEGKAEGDQFVVTPFRVKPAGVADVGLEDDTRRSAERQ